MIKSGSREELEHYIEKYELHSILSEDMRKFMELFTYRRNEHIIRAGEQIEYLYFLVKGKAKVYATLSNGKSLLLCFYKGFRVLGELEILDSGRSVNNVQVIEDSCCIAIAAEHVGKYLLQDVRFLRFICDSLGDKLYQCSRNSSINLLYSLESRLASYIVTTVEKKGSNGHTVMIFDENLTETAELLGTSYRHLLRTLKLLCSERLLRKAGKRYEVTDISELMRISAELY